MVEQPARPSVGGVHGAHEAPRLWEELADCCALHRCEELSSVNAPVVREITQEIEPLRHDRVPAHLLQVEARLAHEVARGHEIVNLLPNVDRVAHEQRLNVRLISKVDVAAVCAPWARVLAEKVLESRKVVLELLLDHHVHQVTRQQHLLAVQRVGAVGLDASRHERVELLHHQHKHLPLVLVALAVHKEEVIEERAPKLLIAPIVLHEERAGQQRLEPLPKVLQIVLLCAKRGKLGTIPQSNLDTV
mmetsp:Transcript_3187/g.7996  ORF Transcript_3187/g.7996 Transcript_3187/m.7996 type:complete len:247 (-) Transcript_3187:913-1653(-)